MPCCLSLFIYLFCTYVCGPYLMGGGNAIFYYYFSKGKKREEKRTRKRKEKEGKKTKQAKEEDHWKLFFGDFFFFLILINQIGGNLDSSVDIAPNQDVDISVSISLGPRSALWEKGEKIGVGEKKGSLGRGEGVGAWRLAFDAADPPSSNKLAIEMLTRHVLITDVSVSLLCRSCKKSVWIRDEVRVQAKRCLLCSLT